MIRLLLLLGLLWLFIVSCALDFLNLLMEMPLEMEFDERKIPYEREKRVQIFYKGKPIKTQ